MEYTFSTLSEADPSAVADSHPESTLRKGAHDKRHALLPAAVFYICAPVAAGGFEPPIRLGGL